MTTQPDTPSLLPCPHCGSPAELDTQQHYTYIKQGHTRMGSRIVVYCTVCPAEVGVAREEDECADRDEVIAQWNRRSPSEAGRTEGETMTLARAKAVLAGYIEEDGGLYSLGAYLAWAPGDDKAMLDGSFDLETLEAIVVYCRSLVAPSQPQTTEKP